MFPHLPITLKPTDTLRSLNGKKWDEPTTSSSLIKGYYALRDVPCVDFSAENLRLLLSQNEHVAELLPLALNMLLDNPLIDGDYYEGDVLVAVLELPADVWQKNPQWYITLQLVMYQLEYCRVVELTDFEQREIIERWKALQNNINNTHPIIETMKKLHAPDTMVRDGALCVLYQYKRWHLLTLRGNETDGMRIRSVHFMHADGFWRLFGFRTHTPTLGHITDLGEMFITEVYDKILPNAEAYGDWLRKGLYILGGPTSEEQETRQLPVGVEGVAEIECLMQAKKENSAAVLFG